MLRCVGSANMSKLVAEIFCPDPRCNQNFYRLRDVVRQVTAPKKKKITIFANSRIANRLSWDFLGTIISCDMFGYGTKED